MLPGSIPSPHPTRRRRPSEIAATPALHRPRAAMVAGGAADPKRPRLECHVCGCTDDRACLPFGCWWVRRRPALCSSCVQFFQNVRDPAIRARLLRAGDVRIKLPPPAPTSTMVALAPPIELEERIAQLGGRLFAGVVMFDDERRRRR